VSACVLCGGTEWRTRLADVPDTRFASPGAWSIRECAGCALLQTDPLPTQAELTALYERHYNAGGEAGPGGRYARLRARLLDSPFYRWFLAIDGDISFHARAGAGRLLDVGCNEGRGLERYRANGFDAEGLELNRVAVAAARAKGFVVHETTVEALPPGEAWDVVVLSNVLEHALDPRAMLLAIHARLKPGGELWISLPNAESGLARLFGRAWINWHVPFHVTHFTPVRLARLLGEARFSVVAAELATPSLWVALSALARLFPGRPEMQRRAAPVVALMAVARLLLFPLWWWWDRTRRGDCLVMRARRA
jgi:SAM-dependent methyltransferase